MNFSIFKNRFFSAPQLAHEGIATLLLVVGLTGPVLADKKLNSVAVGKSLTADHEVIISL
jgi:hypothetical protein